MWLKLCLEEFQEPDWHKPELDSRYPKQVEARKFGPVPALPIVNFQQAYRETRLKKETKVDLPRASFNADMPTTKDLGRRMINVDWPDIAEMGQLLNSSILV